jgi:hypothetical protein
MIIKAFIIKLFGIDKIFNEFNDNMGKAIELIQHQAEKIERLERLKTRGESVNDYLKQAKIMMKNLIELRDNTDLTNTSLVKNSINKICARLAFGVDELKRIREEKEKEEAEASVKED